MRYNSNGSLDTSFDGDGKLTTAFGLYEDAGQSIKLQSDGKILVAGWAWNGTNEDFALARYNTDGSLDTSFDGDGKLTTDVGTRDDNGWSVTLQTDGKILVAGDSDTGTNNDFALARYNTDGSLDTSFDGDGKLTTAIGSYIDYGRSVTLQPDGKILVGGAAGAATASHGTYYDFALVRYNTDGSLDTSFSGDGKLITDFGSGSDWGNDVTLQPDGKILVAGYAWNGTKTAFALARYNTNGSLDTSFDGDGKLTTAIWLNVDFGYSVTLQTDGKILVAGYTSNNSSDDFALARYNTDGSLDTSFDGDGKLTTAFGAGLDRASSVTVQVDGKILVAGDTSNGTNYDFALARYNTNGSLDTSFDAQNTLDNNPTTAEQTAVLLDGNVQIYDAELSASGNYAGATLTLVRQGGASTQDEFSAKSGGTLGSLAEGGGLSIGGVAIGQVSSNSAGTLVLTFDANATQTRVNAALQQIVYRNNSDAPPTAVQIDWTFSDGNTGVQGVGGALSTTGSTTVTITAVNDAPTATNLSAAESYTEDTPLNLTDIVISDMDSANVTATLTLANIAAGSLSTATSGAVTSTYNAGTGVWSASGALASVNTLLAGVTFTPASNFNANFTVTTSVSDGVAAALPGTKSFTGTAVNDAPVASAGTASGAEDTAITGTVSATDIEGGSLTYSAVAQPSHGSVVVNANGSYTYTPAANYVGSDSFTFKANDGSVDSNTATVSITVTAVNDAPVLANVLPDQGVTVGASVNYTVAANSFSDVDSPTLTYSAALSSGAALPSWLSFNPATRTFSGTPTAAQIGSLDIRVTASDASLSASDAFTLVVSDRPNTSPIASNTAGSTNEDTALTASLPAATDGESDPITYAKASNPAHGTVTVTASGSYTYTPTANYFGTDSFGYSVSDGQGGSNSYTVSLTVNPVNDAPTGSVTITGAAALGQTLTAASTLADPDGLGSVGYQWLADGSAISGATGAIFVLTQAQVGKVVTVAASYTDGLGTPESKVSPGTTVVVDVDTQAPTVATFTPSDEATGVAVGSDVVVVFTEAIARGTGSIFLKTSDGIVIAEYNAATSSNLVVTGNTLTINPSADLGYGTGYKVEFAVGTIKDLAGNSYGGTSSYNFTTLDASTSGLTLTGTPAPDTLTGGLGADTINGLGGNDLLTGGLGNDTLDGGAGLDTGAYSTRHAAYTVAPAGSGWSISGPDGTDTLISIERLQFQDAHLAFDLDGNAGQVYRLYKAAFARVPDLGGLGYWIARMDDASVSLEQAASGFIASAEFQSLYGANPTHTQFITALYLNVMERVPEPEGLAYWLDKLNTNELNRAQVLLGFSESPENKNKTADLVADGILYVDATQAAGPARGQLFNGTAGADTLIGTAGADTLIGTAGADTLIGSVGADTLTGGAGNDRLLGGAGNDSLIGGAGDDSLIGGGGIDIAVYAGTRASHTITIGATDLTVSGSADGSDSLLGVERLKFDDGARALDIDGNAGQVYRLYQAAFDRTPDTAGLSYHLRSMDAGLTLQKVTTGFIASAEFQSLYGANPSNAQFIELLYANVLNRAPDPGGYAHWNERMNAGETRELVLIGFSESPEYQAAVLPTIQGGIAYVAA